MTRETVLIDTPARRATSFIVDTVPLAGKLTPGLSSEDALISTNKVPLRPYPDQSANALRACRFDYYTILGLQIVLSA
jgi:hypothetical protein